MPRAVPLLLIALALFGCREERAERQSCRPEPKREPRKYALLVNGDTERRHGRNIAQAWRTLRSLGFAAESITVLTPKVALPKEVVPLRAVESEFKAAMDRLAAAAQPGDLVVVYGTGHGDTSEEGESYLELRRGEVWAFDLRDYVERLRGDTVVVLDQCFSGGFGDAFDGTSSRVMVVTTVDAEHPTECTYFAGAFWDSFTHPERADRNRDGKTSVREAFTAALKAHQEALAGDPELRSNGACRGFNGLEDAFLN